MEKYNQFSFTDFLEDDFFRAYVRHREAGTVARWEAWLETAPPSRAAYAEAVTYLEAVFSARRMKPTDLFGTALWQEIGKGIVVRERSQGRVLRLRVLASAAVACLCLALGATWYYQSMITVTTGNAEMRDVVLPDHSMVILNANSSVSYHRAWAWRRERAVWLKGEALFKVLHLNRDTADIRQGERFIAYAGNLSVEVLGTTFNIRQRRNQVDVALLEGIIRVKASGTNGAPLILHTGESVEYTGQAVRITPVSRLTNQPQAWTAHKVVAKGMTVAEIIQEYEDTYGYHVVLENSALAAKRIDGTLYLDTEDDVLFMLANILNTNIDKHGDTIYLRTK